MSMLSTHDAPAPSSAPRVAVTWAFAGQVGFAWQPPRVFRRSEREPEHAKAIGHCPAVIDLEARLFEIQCPLDVTLRVQREVGAGLAVHPTDNTLVREFSDLVSLSRATAPPRTILEIRTPYVFHTRDQVYVTLLPPFASYEAQSWPGVVQPKRAPVARACQITWTFDWRDLEADLILKRGEPLCYLTFEARDPSRRVRLVAETTASGTAPSAAALDGIVRRTSRWLLKARNHR